MVAQEFSAEIAGKTYSLNINDASSRVETTNSLPHPLHALSIAECDKVRDAVLKARDLKSIIKFRTIFLSEPIKKELLPFLRAEHIGDINDETPRPARLGLAHYDIVQTDRTVQYHESTIDINTGQEIDHRSVGVPHHSALTIREFQTFIDAIDNSVMFKEALAKIKLPDGFKVQIDPWPYGGPDPDEQAPRYMQGLCFAVDTRSNNPDTNHYGYPLPLIPVMDSATLEVVRVDILSTGGKEDALFEVNTGAPGVLDHCHSAEYVPELLGKPLRSDLKSIDIKQPEGPSFTVSDESLVTWQKWRFRIVFTPREGAVLYDVMYDGREVMHRVSISEMTVPYGDPRPPFHRKQAFDFGDAGAGRAANNLSLGCDCLGVIKYFDALDTKPDGSSDISKNVVCLHEQDAGIGWKHTNFRTGRAVVTRSRELVVQFIITLANYEYIFAMKFDLAGSLTIETRATGIVSVVNIDAGKTSNFGNVVSPGVLAQNHQHIFCVRIDPAVDGQRNTVLYEESLPMDMSAETNPWGNGYEIKQTPFPKPGWCDASPFTNRTIKIINPGKKNSISQKPVSYKFIPSATQLLLAHPDSIQAKRAQFAQHHVWVTKHKDFEFWAGGEFTNQSKKEVDGLADAVARGETLNVEDGDDVVVWNVFGLTHNPRVEDWPVMPCEVHQLHISPSDFFSANPAIDVPGGRNEASVLVDGKVEDCCSKRNGDVQAEPESHFQGGERLISTS